MSNVPAVAVTFVCVYVPPAESLEQRPGPQLEGQAGVVRGAPLRRSVHRPSSPGEDEGRPGGGHEDTGESDCGVLPRIQCREVCPVTKCFIESDELRCSSDDDQLSGESDSAADLRLQLRTW